MDLKTDGKHFRNILATLGVVFQRELNDFLFKAYFAALSDLGIQQVESAAGRWIRTGTQFPRPAELRNEVLHSNAQDGEQALELALRNNDPYRSIKFEDGAIMVAIERVFGSWGSFCDQSEHLPDEQFVWKRKEFVAAYRSAAFALEQPRSNYFRGLFESGNNQFPERIPVVRIIGLEGQVSEIDPKLLEPPERELGDLLLGPKPEPQEAS